MIPTWSSPGPVSTAFVDSTAPVSVLMGPAGSGKTVTGLQKGVLEAFRWPETEPGVRRVRFLVMRQKMTDMEGSTLPSWHAWYPRGMGSFTGKEGSPKRHMMTLAHPYGGRVELEVHFRGLGDQKVDDALRGFEFSFADVDECDLMDADIMATLIKRAGRYPRETLSINPKRVWGTCNAPLPDSWVVQDLIEEPREGWKLFRQPSGLSPQAENLAVLGPNWYREQALILPDYERKRFVENIPGLIRDAAAVYPEFRPSLHVSETPLRVVKGRRCYLGLDAGGTPAAFLWQEAPDGQWRGLAELSTHGASGAGVTGPRRFGQVLAQLLAERAPGAEIIARADPSSAYGADRAAGEASWMEIVGQETGLNILPALTQDPTLREEALRRPLTRLLDGGKAGLLLDPSCTLMARALASDYRFTITAGRRSDRPAKNWASHLVEAAQYGLLEGSGVAQVMGRARPQPSRTHVGVPRFNPFSRRHG
ncbi:hypothetical protein [Roseococcus thiosulfatophilus]|uniref:hypothetical protein n=1 Tax=Roseococcus thiosulfatophilus TaxID=35813 RepID=UPI001A8ECA54|nr:hypothetical protein [Roseococcus thiosulfatophilus]